MDSGDVTERASNRRESTKDADGSTGSSPARQSRGERAARGGRKSKNGEERGHTDVYLANLPYDSDEAQIQRVFEEFGSVIKTKVTASSAFENPLKISQQWPLGAATLSLATRSFEQRCSTPMEEKHFDRVSSLLADTVRSSYRGAERMRFHHLRDCRGSGTSNC